MELIDYCRYYMIPIIITAVWLCLSVAFFFWKKNRGCAPAIFVFGGMALLAFVWPHWTTNIGDYKAEVLDRVNQEEWQSLDPQLRLRLNDVVKLTQPLYNNSDTVINPDKLLDGKFIAVTYNHNTSDTTMVSTLEHRINEALKEHNQFCTVANELDYAIVFYSSGDYDKYGRNGHSSVYTEQGTAFVVDFKTDSIVKVVQFMPENPYSIQVKKHHEAHYEYMLSKEDLYIGVMRTEDEKGAALLNPDNDD